MFSIKLQQRKIKQHQINETRNIPYLNFDFRVTLARGSTRKCFCDNVNDMSSNLVIYMTGKPI